MHSNIDDQSKAVWWICRLNEAIPSKKKANHFILDNIQQIDVVRKNVNQIKDINDTLEKMIKEYEVSIDSDQQQQLRHRIAVIIQQGNSIAASSRVCFFLVVYCQVCHPNAQVGFQHQGSREGIFNHIQVRYVMPCHVMLCQVMISLFSQSYNTITHSFVEQITHYQRLQQRYEKILERNYSLPSFLDESINPTSPPISKETTQVFWYLHSNNRLWEKQFITSLWRRALKASCNTRYIYYTTSVWIHYRKLKWFNGVWRRYNSFSSTSLFSWMNRTNYSIIFSWMYWITTM